jgi:hypothetical protein
VADDIESHTIEPIPLSAVFLAVLVDTGRELEQDAVIELKWKMTDRAAYYVNDIISLL